MFPLCLLLMEVCPTYAVFHISDDNGYIRTKNIAQWPFPKRCANGHYQRGVLVAITKEMC